VTTVLLIVGGLILALVVLDWIPGVRHLISPVVSAAGSGIGATVGSTTGWLAWAVKTVWKDHRILLRHLTSKRAAIDPTAPYR